MDDETRVRAKEKLRTMKEYIGYDRQFTFKTFFNKHLKDILRKSWRSPISRNFMRRYISLFSFLVFSSYLFSPQLSVGGESHFYNGINMSVWGTNYAWGKLREKVITIYLNN